MGVITPEPSEPSIEERVADHARKRHEKYGPKLDCEGLDPARNDHGDVYCADCGLLLFRGSDD